MYSLLPLSIKISSKTIGQDLVSVKPMSERYDIDEHLRLKRIEERKKKIDKIIERMKKGE